jgi:hypothetical protein
MKCLEYCLAHTWCDGILDVLNYLSYSEELLSQMPLQMLMWRSFGDVIDYPNQLVWNKGDIL